MDDTKPYYRAHRNIMEGRMTFLEIMSGPNPLTPTEIRALIAKRPATYGYLKRYVK